MPPDHSLRPDDLQSGQHARCQPIQPGKHQTVDAAEGQSLRRFTSQHVELMTKRQDLCLQRRSRPEQSDQRQPNQAVNISHQPRASPDSTSLASRIEFPTMTTLHGFIRTITRVIVDPGSVTYALMPLRMAKKLDPYRETARMALEPWLVEAALARLDRRLSPANQRTIVKATRTPHKVKWPEWWSEHP